MDTAWLASLGGWIKSFWAYLAAFIGICGAVYKYAVLPILKRRRAREEKQEKILNDLAGAVKGLQTSVEELSKDVGFLQHDRLTQGHDHFMKLGYIPTHDRENLVQMYDRYISQKRNSLFSSYRQDLLSLPSTPDGNWGKRAMN